MRYLPHTSRDRSEMLRTIGVSSIDELFLDVPSEVLLKDPIDLPNHMGEIEVERALKRMADCNIAMSNVPSFLGGGAYHHHIPATVDHLIQRSEFLTSYTPYQPEISQGTLQYLFEFQTQVCLLTGMEVANASLYDGATACAEAVMMAKRITGRNRIVLSGGLHPHYSEVTRTFGQFTDMETVFSTDFNENSYQDIFGRIDSKTACVVVQNPCVFGNLRDLEPVARVCKNIGALLIVVVTEVVSLGALRAPGEMGADIVVAEGQSLGNSLNFGGPYLGLLATRRDFVRQMPGRIVGEARDSEGNRGFVLTLSTREQHIRREKATSNICTNSGLCSLAFTIHLSLLGESGFKKLAHLNHSRAVTLANELDAIGGVAITNKFFFNEFTVSLPKPASEVVELLAVRGILAGIPLNRLFPYKEELKNMMLVAATELITDDDIFTYVEELKGVLT